MEFIGVFIYFLLRCGYFVYCFGTIMDIFIIILANR